MTTREGLDQHLLTAGPSGPGGPSISIPWKDNATFSLSTVLIQVTLSSCSDVTHRLQDGRFSLLSFLPPDGSLRETEVGVTTG